MSSPYRDGSGTPCPRCGVVMLADDRGDFVCGDGCGTWIAKPALAKLVGDEPLVGSPGVPYWKVEALPATPCFACRLAVEDLYVTLGERVMAVGQCPEHGVWLERGTRALGRANFEPELARHRDDVVVHPVLDDAAVGDA